MSDTSTLHDLHEASGKVREMYGFGDRLLMVASDRISAFDVVLPTPIPDKGRVLTGLSHFWFGRTEEIIPNHLITTDLSAYPPEAQGAPDLAARSMLVKRLTMMPIECVVRGYLVGSGWKDYQATGTVCGHSLPEGMVEAQKLPKPLFTPSTKATDGHDQNIDRAAGVLLVGEERFDRLAEVSIELYETAAEYALERGIIIADTKFEFGADEAGRLVLGDEALTPGLLAVLARRRVRHRRLAAVLRQAVRPRLARDARLGQERRRAPRSPRTSSPARGPATSRHTSG